MAIEKLRDKVERGVAMLDRELPGWRAKVNGKQLRMETCASCILGQLFGGLYSEAASTFVFGVTREAPASASRIEGLEAFAVEHGLFISGLSPRDHNDE